MRGEKEGKFSSVSRHPFSVLGSLSSPIGSRGFTLMELMLAVILFAVLGAATTLILRTLLVTWSSQERRGGIDINLDRGIEEMARDLRKAREVQSTADYDEIRFRQGTTSSNYYIFYLYNADDSYVPPPAFNQSSYQLRRATLSGGINGTFTYGSGDIVVNDVTPPPTSDLSLASNLITVDLTVTRGDETIRSRTQVRPRNLWADENGGQSTEDGERGKRWKSLTLRS